LAAKHESTDSALHVVPNKMRLLGKQTLTIKTFNGSAMMSELSGRGDCRRQVHEPVWRLASSQHQDGRIAAEVDYFTKIFPIHKPNPGYI
jgi:hypothetical protein